MVILTNDFASNDFTLLLLFSSSLMSLICDLLESSVNIQQQLIQNKGFLVISYLLEKVRNLVI